jgi:S1-C subfamily serine protease
MPSRHDQPSLVITSGEAGGQARLPVAVLIHLSGPRRGASQRLEGEMLRLGAGGQVEVRVSPEPMVAEHHATLRREQSSYLVTVEPDRQLWVNGEPVRQRLLASGDVLEIGRDGPILRFRLYPAGTALSKSVAEAFLDGIDGARFGSGSTSGRLVRGLAGAVRELATQTTLVFRLGTIATILALVAITVALLVRSRGLERRLAREELRVEGLAALIAESRQVIDPRDLEAMRGEVSAALERVEALEARRDAPTRVVSLASSSVILLQGTYGFVEPEGGNPLRFVAVDARGMPITGERGEPMVGLDGDGPPVEAQFLGTAFVASTDGLLLTNRHVALPWEFEAAARLLIAQGLEPVMTRLIGFLPGVSEPFDAEFVVAAESFDLAVLRASALTPGVVPLALRGDSPTTGDEVIVLGYPAGIRALLARSEAAFVNELMRDPSVDFWEVTRRLAAAGQIGPLASRGIVAQVSANAVVYDAETTRGGSGGPVLDLDGEVVAITSAVVTEFGGSNLGVPAERARRLLAVAGQMQSEGAPASP